MKDVYLKNPQMGDPASLDHKLAEVTQNIERLRLETQKFEVWGTGAKEGAARGRVPLGRPPGSPLTHPSVVSVMAVLVYVPGEGNHPTDTPRAVGFPWVTSEPRD